MIKLFWVVLAKTLICLSIIWLGLIHLSPDEAQYWTWSQHPALGYYSKPPGIAYQILFGTALFGNTELGVRFGSLLIGFILPFLLYRLGLKAGLSENESFWGAVVWCFIPLGFMGSILSITDVGMILFWVWGCLELVERGASKKLGLIIAMGALFKFPIYFFWIFALFVLPWNRHLLIAMGISLLGLIPSLIWNIQNNFATFKHVTATLPGGTSAVKSQSNPLEFLGAQVALFSPVLFAGLIASYVLARKEKLAKPILFLATVSLPTLLAGWIVSFFTKIQGNWIDFAYPTAALFLVWACFRYMKWGRPFIYAGLGVSVILIAASFFLPYKISPYRHNLGWEEIAPALIKGGYDPRHQFLFADSYQTTALLSFYAPEQKQAYFFNLNNIRQNQFDYWPSMADQEIGRDGLFVIIDNGEANSHDTIKRLSAYFNAVRFKGTYPLIDKKKMHVFEGFQYNGKAPQKPSLF